MIHTRVFVAFHLFLSLSTCCTLVAHIYLTVQQRIRNGTKHVGGSPGFARVSTASLSVSRRDSGYPILVFVYYSEYSRTNLAKGNKIEVVVIQELLITRPHKGSECNTFIGLDILNKILS